MQKGVVQWMRMKVGEWWNPKAYYALECEGVMEKCKGERWKYEQISRKGKLENVNLKECEL
jgi:hypothetical protein